ncbi:MAG TPA: beta-ketoacyl-[acyl-carrier-protein] synthase family protein [Nannocystaceae bacterium]|nr:beta-ketoacyl-[acyl-carrier-protein] synthase family protein [Nannocystaceae bacterium]
MRDPEREVVVTGVGVCTNMGDDLGAVTQRLRSGEGGPFVRYELAERYQCRCRLVGLYAGDVSDDAIGIKKAEGRFLGRASRLALKAARTALAQSALDRRDVAVVVGSGTGDVETHQQIHDKLRTTGDAKKILPTVIPRIMASTVSANLVNVLRTTGPSFTATAACAGGAYNLLLAAELIEHGHCDCAIAGGTEVADPHFYAGFDSMRAYNGQDNDHPERASRPYAADRAGFVFGEGAGILVLETRASANARGAEILGSIRGYGMSSDGEGEMVAPARDGAMAAMRRALKHGGVAPEDIDYINTHGTSTPLGDVSEVSSIRQLFDGRAVPYSSTKGYTGHTVSACGAIEAIFTLAMMREGWIAPSIHADPLDPALVDYPPVRTPTRATLELALSNSFGFGGTNVTLVLGH